MDSNWRTGYPPVPEDYANPDWPDGGRVHNWHTHVPEQVREVWSTFTDDQKQRLAKWAEEMASAEHWD